jgi:TRAP-type C4-dicarboxylate transport system permease small subunit
MSRLGVEGGAGGDRPVGRLLPIGPPAPRPIAWLASAVDWSIVAIGATMATLVFANVILHLLSADIAWTTEFCELLLVWVTFLGAAAATRRGAHMVIGELIGRLPGPARRLADAGIQVVVLVTLGLLVWYGAGIADAGRGSELTVLGWPMAAQYAALPVASVVTMVFVGWDLIEILRGRTHAERYGETPE